MRARLGPPDEMHPFPNQGLSRLIRRMRLAGDDELHRSLRIAQQAKQSLGVVQQQVRSLVGREAARKAQRQARWDQTDASRLRPPRAARRRRPVASDNRSRAYSTSDLLASVRNCHSLASETRRMSCSRVSVVPSQRSLPQPSVQRSSAGGRVPGRHVDSVGHVSDRHFVLRPARKQRPKEPPAHLPVQAAHAIDRPAAADGQIRHVERLRRVVRVLAAQGQQIVKGDAELLSA